jgi:hypothetical protein
MEKSNFIPSFCVCFHFIRKEKMGGIMVFSIVISTHIGQLRRKTKENRIFTFLNVNNEKFTVWVLVREEGELVTPLQLDNTYLLSIQQHFSIRCTVLGAI